MCYSCLWVKLYALIIGPLFKGHGPLSINESIRSAYIESQCLTLKLRWFVEWKSWYSISATICMIVYFYFMGACNVSSCCSWYVGPTNPHLLEYCGKHVCQNIHKTGFVNNLDNFCEYVCECILYLVYVHVECGGVTWISLVSRITSGLTK